MNLKFTQEEEAFRQTIRDFLKEELPSSWEGFESLATEEGWAFYRSFVRKMGVKGWLNMHWPKEYGGMSATPMQQLIFTEEMAYHGAPAQIDLGPWVGSTIIVHGSEEQKRKYLPGIATGEAEWCIGYSEPGAGSDLAALQTQAVEDGDEYVINGQKIFTSLAHRADYCWLAARTDRDVPKHKGISMFVVDMSTPGITVRPLIDMAGHHTFNEVFFDEVRIPRENMVGGMNQGWYLLLTELDIERTSFGGGVNISARSKSILEELVQYTNKTKKNGEFLSKNPVIRQKLAERAVEIEVSRLLAYRLSWMLSQGIIANYEASVSKLFGSEVAQRLANTGMEILGLYGQLEPRSKWVLLRGRIEQLYLWAVAETIGAGTSEIQRNIIAMRGLALPRG